MADNNSDPQERKKIYDYKSNFNLVLKTDRSQLPGRSDEPNGEPETLWGKIDPKEMGSRAIRSRPSEDTQESGIKASASSIKSSRAAVSKGKPKGKESRSVAAFSSILEAVNDFEGLKYRPRTAESREAYGMILHYVQGFLGDQTQEVLRDAVDDILATMHTEDLKDFDKKKAIEELLAVSFDNDQFTQLVNLCKRINDYSGGADGSENVDGNAATEMDDSGVAVVFDDEEAEEEEEMGTRAVYDIGMDEEEEEEYGAGETATEMETGMVPSIEDENEDEEVITARGPSNKSADKIGAEKASLDLHPRDVDAYWLQRHISSFYADPQTASEVSETILAILEKSSGIRDCENSLVKLLEFDKFDLVKMLTRNRFVILWCTKLARSSSSQERTEIENVMISEGHEKILHELKAAKAAQETAVDNDTAAQTNQKRSRLEQNDVHMSHAPQKVLDLESLAFAEGSHVMTNKKCVLPEGSFKTTKQGYEEVQVPAPKPPSLDSDEKLVPIPSLPEWSQSAFKGANSLNRVQSRVYPIAFGSDENMLLCAPTGAGKTNVAMLTILREIGKHINAKTGEIKLDAFKIIYVAPMKALVQEMVGNFSSRLTEAYGIRVAELTGDRQMTKQQIAETQIIVTTPEKWDVITRKSFDRSYTQLVKLIIIDEIHLLHDDRGPVLEAIVSRTIRNMEQTQQYVRLVGLSATLPNYMDVAHFLRVEKERGLFFFDSSFRPCPLQQNFIGVTEKKVMKRYHMMNEITYEKCLAQAGKNQILVFVHSRKETAKTAKAIRDMAIEKQTISAFIRQNSASREILAAEAESTKNADLQDLLPFGFAIHHAGMTRLDRTLVEDLFADGHIQILVSTATLAWGVNLPAHTVIIKGTQIYSPEKGKWIELSPQDVLQMLGRAGRPQYDTFGEGIIITAHSELQYYLSLLNTQLPIESQMISKLPDMMNAEIVLGNIKNREDAVQWLGYSYLYIRMLRAPNLYGITAEEAEEDQLLEQKRIDLVHSAAIVLERSNLIKYDRRTGKFQSTELGRIASHYYVIHKSMSTYNQHLKPTTSLAELFKIFALSDEFKLIPVRVEEKPELLKLLERVPIPVKESPEESASKINVLLQAYISQLKLEGFALVSDMVYITQSAGRILRAIFEICLRKNWALLARKVLDLCKMVEHRMWSSMSPIRQFKGVSMDLMKRLEKKDFPWSRMYDLNPAELGELVRNPKAGKLLHKLVHEVPKVELMVSVQPITRSILRMDLTVTPDFNYDLGQDGKPGVHNPAGEMFWILVEDCDSERLLYSDQLLIKPKFAKDDHFVSFTVPLFEPLPPNYFVSVISDRWIRSETRIPVSFKNLILPAKFPPHTELMDLQPLPVDALGRSEFISYFKSKNISYFSPILTQCFQTLFASDENVLIGTPSGSGQIQCAELAIMRKFASGSGEKIFYVCTMSESAKEKYLYWRSHMEKTLDVSVGLLHGETTADLKTIDRSDLIVGTSKQWDLLTRRWRQRKVLQAVGLFIFEDLHLIGGKDGHILEAVVSRARYMSAQLERSIRIVALSASLGNARDVGEWLGCQTSPSSSTVFNFHPNVRPIPLEIHMQGFNIPHFASLMIAMSRPVYNGISKYCCIESDDGSKQAVVFVAGRKQCQKTAVELVDICQTDANPRKFLRLPNNAQFGEEKEFERAVEQSLGSFLSSLESPILKASVLYGIGFFHEALSEIDKKIVLRLYEKKIIRILIASHDSAWGLFDPSSGEPIVAHLSVIMGTQYYEGKEHRYVDYSMAEILQMCGKAEVSDVGDGDDEGVARVLFLCPQNKREFYTKFLYEGLPVESHFDQNLHNHFNAEIATKTIENKQDAVDYLTWTFLYRRMAQNPNYYNLTGVSNRLISDHLSELVENTLSDLATSKCIEIGEDDMTLSPLNLGLIAAYYYINYLTIEVLSMSLTAGTKLRGLLEIISSASEFESVPVRHKEDGILQKLYDRCPVKLSNSKMSDPFVKTNILLQSHFSRFSLPADLLYDLNQHVLTVIIPIICACIDVISSNGWLSPALACMELCQMVVQAMWGDRESPLKQLPYFDTERIELAKSLGIKTIFDLMEIDDEELRNRLLEGLSQTQVANVANVANRYPNIDVSYVLQSESGENEMEEDADGEMKKLVVKTRESVYIDVSLKRDVDEEDEESNAPVPPVSAPFFPSEKEESWWLVVANPDTKQLLSIKRLTLQKNFRCKLEFNAQDMPGLQKLKLYFMCDSWIGCDQEYEFQLQVEQGMELDEQ